MRFTKDDLPAGSAAAERKLRGGAFLCRKKPLFYKNRTSILEIRQNKTWFSKNREDPRRAV